MKSNNCFFKTKYLYFTVCMLLTLPSSGQLIWPVMRNTLKGTIPNSWKQITATFGERHIELHHAVDSRIDNNDSLVATHSGILKDIGNFLEITEVPNLRKTRYGDKTSLINMNQHSTFVQPGDLVGRIKELEHCHLEIYYWDTENTRWISVHPLRQQWQSVNSPGLSTLENLVFEDFEGPIINDVVLEPEDNLSGIKILSRHQVTGKSNSIERLTTNPYLNLTCQNEQIKSFTNNIIIHIDDKVSDRIKKTTTPFDPIRDTVIIWGTIGPTLQCRDIAINIPGGSGLGYSVYSAKYSVDGEKKFELGFDEIVGIQGEKEKGITTEKRITSIYHTDFNNCVQTLHETKAIRKGEKCPSEFEISNLQKVWLPKVVDGDTIKNKKGEPLMELIDGYICTKCTTCINEQYTGNYDWLKLSHLRGEENLEKIHKKINGENSDGKFKSRQLTYNTSSNNYARSNHESFYTDGEHIINFEVSDWSNKSYTKNIPVIVDNFKPYIEEISVHINGTGPESKIRSIIREFVPFTGEIVTKKDTLCANSTCGKPIFVKFKTSERLNHLSVRVQLMPGNILPIEPPTIDKDTLTYTYQFAPLCHTKNDPAYNLNYQVEIRGRDLSMNELIQLQENDTLKKVPIRKDTIRWENDRGSGPDRSMMFSLNNINEKPKLSVPGSIHHEYCISQSPEINLKMTASDGTPPYTFNWPEECDPLDANSKCITIYGGSATLKSTVKDNRGCVTKKDVYVSNVPIICLGSADPNDLVGPTGVDSARWVAKKDTLPYRIRFENDPKLANAPAQRIYLEVPIDPEADPSTFRIGKFGLAGREFTLPTDRIQYQGRVDARDAVGVWVDVIAGLNTEGTKAFWILQAVDPATGMPPADATLGLLPVNDSITQRGTGFADFTIRARKTTVTGDTLSAKASIIFDQNEAIPTNLWKNQIDAVAPESQLLPSVGAVIDSTSIPLRWTGHDDPGGSGIGGYNLWVSQDGAAFELGTAKWPDTTYIQEAEPGHVYRFALQAVDRVGNEEVLDTTAPLVVYVKDDPRLDIVSVNSIGLCGGDSLRMVWASAAMDSVDISYSIDNGQTFLPLTSHLPDSLRYFAFQVGNPSADQTLLLQIADAAMPSRKADTLAVVVHPRPVVSATPSNATICAGEPLELVASGVIGGDYYWSPYYLLNRPDSSHVRVTATETTQYVVTARDANGCTARDSATVTIHPRDSIYLEGIACTPADTGLFVQTLQNRFGCDSIIALFNVLDTFAPVVVTKNFNLTLGAGGQATLSPQQVDNGTFDDCSFILALSRTAFGCADTGQQAVWLIATDLRGNVDNAAAFVTVLGAGACDPLGPNFTFSYTGPDTLPVGVNCTAPLAWGTGTPTADAGPGHTVASFALDPALTGYQLGDPVPANTTVTVAYIAVNEILQRDTFYFDLFFVDQTPPTISCPPNTTVAANPNCAATVGNWALASKTDYCTAPALIAETQTTPPTTAWSGHNATQTVTLQATDAAGNTATCAFELQLKDVTPPTIVCPPNATVAANTNCAATVGNWALVSKTDYCTAPALIAETQTTPATTTWSGHNATQTVALQATDAAGNTATCAFELQLKDVTAPTITCPAAPLPIAGSGTPCAATVNGLTGVYGDNCSGATLTHTRSGASTGSGSGQINGQIFNSGSTTVTYTVTDAGGLTATCSFVVTVLSCQKNLSGRVIWKQDNTSGVKDVTLTLGGDQVATKLTPPNGTYAFEAINGANFTITPSKNTNKLNGLNASDVLRIQQHLNGNPITNPWQLIAADVNSNNLVSALDANIIQLALLGNPQALTQFVKSWRFVPVNHPLANPPWGFPEHLALTGISASQANLDFYAIKVGDLVATYANPANAGQGTVCTFDVPDYALQTGENISVAVEANPFADLAAFQLALRFDPGQLRLTGIEPLDALPLSPDNFGTQAAEQGVVRVLWAGNKGLSLRKKAPVFRLNFTVLRSGGQLSDVLGLADLLLPAQAYASDLSASPVALCFDGTTETQTPGTGGPPLQLLQNRPNPFQGETIIGFVLPEACAARLRVVDAAGRTVVERSGQYTAGRHEETFLLNNLSGMLYYELITPFGVLAKKMVVIAE